jgi:hypothetical protein
MVTMPVARGDKEGGSSTTGGRNDSYQLKSIFSLTTKITSMEFHPSGQILAMASKDVSYLKCQ